jgi:CRP/FNR family transcriptional regulator
MQKKFLRLDDAVQSSALRQTPSWLDSVPELAAIRDTAWLKALKQGKLMSLPPESIAFNPASPCTSYLILLEGCLRVQQISTDGREILLYRVQAGQACVLTVACMLANLPYSAQGVAETPIKVAAIPREPFLYALHHSLLLQNHVFGQFCNKLHYMMDRFEQMAFGSVEFRLARHLLEVASGESSLHLTHELLAREMGTNRVVISRALKDLERQGLLVCGRNLINLNLAALQTYITQHPL